MGHSIFTSEHILAAAAGAAFLISVWERLLGWQNRRQEEQALAAAKTDVNISRLEAIALAAQRATDEILTVLKGRESSDLDPRPGPGLVDVVLAQGDKLEEHSQILKKLQPNGGNTDNTGDLILKLAKQAGVSEQEKNF